MLVQLFIVFQLECSVHERQ